MFCFCVGFPFSVKCFINILLYLEIHSLLTLLKIIFQSQQNKQMLQSFSSSCTGWSSSTVLCSERLLLPAEEPVPPPFSCACSSPPSPSPPFWWPAVPLSFGPLRPRFSFPPPLVRFSILGRLRTPAVLRCVPSFGSMRVLAGAAAA